MKMRDGNTFLIMNRGKHSDLVVLREIYFENQNEYFKYFVPQGTVLDIGANTGIFANYTSKRFGKKVISYEASSKNFDYWKINMHMNHNPIKGNNLAISKESKGKLKLYLTKEGSGGNSILKQNIRGDKFELVDQIRLDEILTDEIDFMKIDVEGAEFEILFSLKKLEVPRIAMEVHAHPDYKMKDLVALLERFGYLVKTTSALILAEKRK